MGAHGSQDGASGAMKEQNHVEQADLEYLRLELSLRAPAVDAHEDGPDRGEQ